ncbi:hypothetical protein SERLA73DRAFT_65511, partial [Serpula lacrymans var. lacrymans S7.3]
LTPSMQTEDGRPAGGTARSGGTRTPRRVQWAQYDDVRPLSDPTHALDEAALDPDAFQTLTHALERHRSTGLSRPALSTTGLSRPALSTTGLGPVTSVPSSASTDPAHTPRSRASSPSPSLSTPPLTPTSPPPPSPCHHFARAQAGRVVSAHTRRHCWGWSKKPKQKSKPTRSKHHSTVNHRSAAADEDEEETELDEKPQQSRHHGRSKKTGKSTTHPRSPSSSPPASPAPYPPLSSAPILVVFQASMQTSMRVQIPRHTRPPLTAPRSPPKSRTAAGVFGPLIASTGNIAGAAAPTSAALGPNLKRRGGMRWWRWPRLPVMVPVKGKGGRRSRRLLLHLHPDLGVGGSPSAMAAVGTGAGTEGVKTGAGTGRKRWSGVLRDLGHASSHGLGLGGHGLGLGHGHRREKREREREREKRRKRKKAEVYITRHVAAILQRQEFILKLARAMMMFGGPTHRLQAQIQSTARVLDVELSCLYLPDVMLISFEDSATGTSNVKFIRQGSALDLGKLGDAHGLYWAVIHDDMSVSSATTALDALMHKKPLYNRVQLVLIGGMCSAAICSVSFSGSFIDCLVVAPLGALLVGVQLLSVRNELYSNIFEITIATLLSFVSAGLASTYHFCYSAVASSSVVLILPGFIVLCGSLEISSRSLVAGAVRLCFALMYSLFLGFGLAMGAEMYQKMVGKTVVGATDYSCVESHDPLGPWWQRTAGLYWAFLTVPMYSFFLSLRNQAPIFRKEFVLLIAVSCIGWVTNHFASTKFPSQSDISAAVGAFAVGFVSNLYGRFFNGNAFVVMITGILFQVPSGLGNGGLLNFVSDTTSGTSSSYLGGFQVALQLISVSIGLTVGLGISLVVVHPVQSRRRAGGVFSL